MFVSEIEWMENEFSFYMRKWMFYYLGILEGMRCTKKKCNLRSQFYFKETK